MKYKKCPRCELNYIPETEDYCEICKQELKGVLVYDGLDDFEGIDFESEGICPRCKTNYVAEGEKYCHSCLIEIEEQKGAKRLADIDEPDDWAENLSEEDEEALDISDEELGISEPVLDKDEELSLDELAEQEGWNDDEDEDEDKDDDHYDGPDIDQFEEVSADEADDDDEDEDEDKDEDED